MFPRATALTGIARRISPRVRRALELTLGVAVLCAVAWHVDPVLLWSGLHSAQPALLAVAALCSLAVLAAQQVKWMLLLRTLDPGVPQLVAFRALLVGLAYGFITPAHLGEYGGRMFGLHSLGRGRLAGLTAVDKLWSLASAILLGLSGTLLFASHLGYLDAKVAFTAAALPPLVLLALPCAPVLRLRLERAPFLRKLWDLAREPYERLPRAQRYTLLSVTVLFHTAFITELVVLLYAFGGCALDTLHIGLLLIGGATVLFVKTVVPQFTLGELGVREGVMVAVFAALGVAKSAAFNASLLVFAMNVLLPALAGAALLMRTPHIASFESPA